MSTLASAQVGSSSGPCSHSRAFFSGTAENPIYVDHLPAVGEARALPVVMVHGGCHTGNAIWRRRTAGKDGRRALRQGGRDVFVVDWPGHGRSPPCNDLARLATQAIAESLLVFLDAVGPAILMVHSASGPMAWWIAERAPQAVAGILGIAPGAPANILAVLPTMRRGRQAQP